MQKILLIKTSSLGDLIHTMPAISDLQAALPNIELHWLVEEGFSSIPSWHPFVKKTHVCAIRRWRKSLLSSKTRGEIKKLKATLKHQQFDAVIDAQGLVKSAWMVRWLDCQKFGYDRKSIKEPLASRFYSDVLSIEKGLPAIQRVRRLFAQSLNYSQTHLLEDFGLKVQRSENFSVDISQPYIVFLHGTVWNSKVWPVEYWKKMAAELTAKGKTTYIPWGNATERSRAEQIALGTTAKVLDKMPLTDIAYLLQNASLVIGSDTGLSHVAAALGAYTIGLYGPTSSDLTGLIGVDVLNIKSSKSCSPCFKRDCPLLKDGELIPCYESISAKDILNIIDIKVLNK